MYKVKISEEERSRIANGNTGILLQKLEETNKALTKDLKTPNCGNIAYLQGISSVTDELIAILTRSA